MTATMGLVDLRCSIKQQGQVGVLLDVHGEHVETSPGADLNGWKVLEQWVICPRHRSVLITPEGEPAHIRIE